MIVSTVSVYSCVNELNAEYYILSSNGNDTKYKYIFYHLNYSTSTSALNTHNSQEHHKELNKLKPQDLKAFMQLQQQQISPCLKVTQYKTNKDLQQSNNHNSEAQSTNKYATQNL